MPVVSNTSPILNLALIGRLSLLKEQFSEIWIPLHVRDELRIAENLPGSHVMRDAIEQKWLHTVEVGDDPLVKILRRDLHRGEAEAIALAMQLEANWVLLDEREGRRVAKSLGLKVTGVLGILLQARRDGRLASMRQAMEDLRDSAGFWIGSDLALELLKQANED